MAEEGIGERKKGWRDHARAIRRSVGLIWTAAPREVWSLLVLTFVAGAAPSILLWLGKVVIDELTQVGPGSVGGWRDLAREHAGLAWAVAGFLAINLLLDFVQTLVSFQANSLSERVRGAGQERLAAKVADLPSISVFETPRLLDQLHLAEAGIWRLQMTAMSIAQATQGLFALAVAVVVSVSIAWWVPLLVLLVSTPSIYVQLRYEFRLWDVEERRAPRLRRMQLQWEVLTRPEYAKELRIFGLERFFLGRWRELFGETFAEMQVVRRRGTAWIIAWSLISGLGTALPYLVVVMRTARGSASIGEVALFAGLIFQMRQNLYVTIANVQHLQNVALGVRALFAMLDYEESEGRGVGETKGRERTHGGKTGSREDGENDDSLRRYVPAVLPSRRPAVSIEFEQVSFRYPGAERAAVEEIELRIAPGETVVVVGDNGAGKTTIAKLLCRLYDPTDGVVRWNGVDYRERDIDELRGGIGAVFQDYSRFPASLRENVGFGALGGLEDVERVRTAAAEAGLAELAGRLPRGFETPLSKQLEDGTELSGGQWQRVAIARALMRQDARLLVLDEPTAALDARTEHEILGVFRRLVAGRTAVIVSHRLALARIADTIVVMEQGRIVERGNHDALMERRGVYWQMFTRQASSYVE